MLHTRNRLVGPVVRAQVSVEIARGRFPEARRVHILYRHQERNKLVDKGTRIDTRFHARQHLVLEWQFFEEGLELGAGDERQRELVGHLQSPLCDVEDVGAHALGLRYERVQGLRKRRGRGQ